jgi:hypothetical protein
MMEQVHWNSRLTFLSDPLNNLRMESQDDELWINMASFIKYLQSKTQGNEEIKTSNIKSEVGKHVGGVKIINDKLHISARSAIRYIVNHCDKRNICKRIVDQIMSVLLINRVDCSASSYKDIYMAVARTNFLTDVIDEYIYSSNDLTNYEIPTLYMEHKDDFKPTDWNKICVFEMHFNKHFEVKPEHTHAELVEAKWKFFETLQSATSISKDCQKLAQSTIKHQNERKRLASHNAAVYFRKQWNTP